MDKKVKIHEDKYVYSKVNYINKETKIITCKTHENFIQRPPNIFQVMDVVNVLECIHILQRNG